MRLRHCGCIALGANSIAVGAKGVAVGVDHWGANSSWR